MPAGYRLISYFDAGVARTMVGLLTTPLKLQYIHATTSTTVPGEIAYGKDGEWARPRTVFSQFQDVQPGNVEQFRDGAKQPVVWPAE